MISALSRARKVNLLVLYDDLELLAPESLKIADIMGLVIESEFYDKYFLKDCLKIISAEITKGKRFMTYEQKRNFKQKGNLKKKNFDLKGNLYREC